MQYVNDSTSRLVFADGTQFIHLADLSDDGLTDLMRICNGEICYWPNLGYCRFGAKVTMDNAPHLEMPNFQAWNSARRLRPASTTSKAAFRR